MTKTRTRPLLELASNVWRAHSCARKDCMVLTLKRFLAAVSMYPALFSFLGEIRESQLASPRPLRLGLFVSDFSVPPW